MKMKKSFKGSLFYGVTLALVGCQQIPERMDGAQEGVEKSSGEYQKALETAEGNTASHGMPAGFVFLSDIDPTIIDQSSFAASFMGKPVPNAMSKVVCTKAAAEALKKAHEDLKSQGYNIVVYDGYRPQRTVDAFVEWSQAPNDQDPKSLRAKQLLYPTLAKQELPRLGYIARESAHTRGSAFALTIIPTGQQVHDLGDAIKMVALRKLTNDDQILYLDHGTVDMGSSIGLFHEVSSHDSPLVTEAQSKMRNLLREVMKRNGFKAYQKLWWHYILENEPYPDQYFDFLVDQS